MPIIIPIKDLRDTKKILDLASDNSPIFITKNGYDDLVLMSTNHYDKLTSLNLNSQNQLNTSVKKVEITLLKSENKHFGFVKVGAANFEGEVANPKKNYEEMIRLIKEANDKKVQILVFPELSLTSYSCGDLFFQERLYEEANKYLSKLVEFSSNYEMLIVVGTFIKKDNAIYNVAVPILKGSILGFIPKTFLPSYKEFYENRQFVSAPKNNDVFYFEGKAYPFGTKYIFMNRYYSDLKIGIEICEDLWVNKSPSLDLSSAGATMILNLSASNEVIGKASLRRTLVSSTSYKEVAAYIYSSSSIGESTTDLVYSGHSMIVENGVILKECELFKPSLIYEDIDIEHLVNVRQERSNYYLNKEEFEIIPFDLKINGIDLSRDIAKNPFLVPFKKKENTYEDVIKMQAYGLYKRFLASKVNKLVLGLSGGLDSTLALLVCLETLKILNLDSSNLIAVSMPSFATSSRTFSNSKKLANLLNVTYKEIDISKTVLSHFDDIGHDKDVHDIAYENAQARERTQILFDIANKENGLVVGTGDLSELCLGFVTYGGDHLSNYSVNSSLPKTLMKEIIIDYALRHEDLKEVLLDIVNTPISPELLPGENKEIGQITEEVIGPYELHDFFIYHFLNNHFSPKKILLLATIAFKDKYDKDTIKKWLTLFLKRFFTNQFKRSALPDGVKVSAVSISPRGDLRISSDVSFESFLDF